MNLQRRGTIYLITKGKGYNLFLRPGNISHFDFSRDNMGFNLVIIYGRECCFTSFLDVCSTS